MTSRLAVIGSGNIAPYHIKSAIKAGFQISCISASNGSTSAYKLAKDFEIPMYFTRTSELIESQEFDAIVVAISPIETKKILNSLVATGKPVLIEKPVVLNSQDLNNFVRNQNIYVGYNRRFYLSIEKIKLSHSESPGYFSFMISEIMNDSKISLIKVRDSIKLNTVHILDLIGYLLGPFELRDFIYTHTNSMLSARIYSQSTYIGEMKISFNSRKNSAIFFENKEINAICKPIENLKIYNSFEIREPTSKQQIRKYVPTWNGDANGLVIEESAIEKPGFLSMYKEFFRVVKDNDNKSTLANLQDALSVLQKAEQIIDVYSKSIDFL